MGKAIKPSVDASDEMVEQARNVDIVALVESRGIELRKVGDEHRGLCPFHDDSNPSLDVSAKKGVFLCRSCGAKGDALDFVRLHDRCSFHEAVLRMVDDPSVPAASNLPVGRRCAERAAQDAMELETERAEAAKRARAIWSAASNDLVSHPYVVKKGNLGFGSLVRRGPWLQNGWDDALLVPIFGRNQNLMSIEAISPRGEKRSLRGGQKSGGFCAIGKFSDGSAKEVIIAEGVATAAACAAATGRPAVATFCKGNLRAVAEAVRVICPDIKIIIAADVGAEREARQAAAAVGGYLAVPHGVQGDGADFWDVWSQHGPDETGRQLLRVLCEAPLASEPEAAPAGDALLADFAQAMDETDPILDPAVQVPTDMVGPIASDVEPDAQAQVVEFEQLLAGGSFVLTETNLGDRMSARSSGLSARLQPAVMPIGADSRDGVTGTFPLTEMGNCHRVVAAYGDDIRFVPEMKAWLVWSGENWLWDTDGARVRGLIGTLAASIYADGVNRFDDAEHFLKWARKSQEARTIRNVEVLLEDVADLRIPVAAIDGDPFLVGVDGARRVIDLRTGKGRAANRSDFVTRSLGVSEIGSAENAIAWKRFLGDVFMNDADVLDWFKRFFGYCLTGSYDEQMFIFAHGGGSNGKSVLVKTMKVLAGEYCRTVAAGTLMEQKRGAGDASPDIAELAGARLLLASETSAGSAFDEQFLKGWTGGDPQVARKLYRDQFTFEPVGKLFIAGNYRPRIGGTDHAIWRRVRLLPFVRTFTDEEKDPTMLDKLRAELPHILAWAIEGCLDWQKRRLKDTPKAMRDAGRQYLVEQDILGEFLQEMTVSGPEKKVTSGELFDCYRSWMVQCNLKPVSRQALGRQLAERGFPSRHTNKGNLYDGIDLALWNGGVGGGYADRHDPVRGALSQLPPF